MTDESQRTRRPRLSQETIAIVTVGVALAGLNLVTTGDLRDLRNEWQAESRQLRDEARADRTAWQAESQKLRDEARADRTAWQAESQKLQDEARSDREAFQREILRLTQGQAEIEAMVASTQPTNA